MKKRRNSINSSQFRTAVAMTAIGSMLLGAAFIVPPTGHIDPSVLVAFGEIMTFAGALFGIDYHYRTRQ